MNRHRFIRTTVDGPVEGIAARALAEARIPRVRTPEEQHDETRGLMVAFVDPDGDVYEWDRPDGYRAGVQARHRVEVAAIELWLDGERALRLHAPDLPVVLMPGDVLNVNVAQLVLAP